MLRGVAVVATDETVWQQARLVEVHRPRIIETDPPSRTYRYFLPCRDLDRLARQLSAARDRVVLLGAGDFHHLTAVLVGALLAPGPASAGCPSRDPSPSPAAGRPLAVVVIDAHPEWSLPPPGYVHCGSWLPELLAWPGVHAAALVGVGPLEAQGLLGSAVLQGIATAAREGRLRVYPVRRSTVQELHGALRWPDPLVSLEDGFDALIADLIDYLAGHALYLSVDKDAVRPEELPGGWGGGEMPADVVLELVRAVAAALPVAGADVCGEYVPRMPALAGSDPGLVLHELFNLRLLETLLAAGRRPDACGRAA